MLLVLVLYLFKVVPFEKEEYFDSFIFQKIPISLDLCLSTYSDQVPVHQEWAVLSLSGWLYWRS